MNTYRRLKEMALHANLRLPELRLVMFTFGNVSVVDRDLGVFAIKPSGVPYTELTAENMVVVDLDGRTVEGKFRPSSDTKTHAVLYRSWEKIGGIAHTHSTYATAWAQAQRAIPVFGTTHADHSKHDIPCAPTISDDSINGDYELETGLQIVNCLKEKNIRYEDHEMILVGSHAPFTWGKTAEKAVYNSALLESLAHMAWLTEQINRSAPRLKEALIKKHYGRKNGPDSYYGQ